MTVAQAYDHTFSELMAGGYDRHEAGITARLLVDKFAGVSHAHLTRSDTHLFNGAEWDSFRETVVELRDGLPLAYLFGTREFFGLDFKCDERALIPRGDTETLVEAAIERLKSVENPLVADLGTGTGCIAISVAHTLPGAVIHATDASRGAIDLATYNANALGVASRLEFVPGIPQEWALPLISHGYPRLYDAVLTNPPYISVEDILQLQPQIREHEPLSALDGGEDGLDCYRQIAAQCQELLAPGGFLMAELGAGQFTAVRDIFRVQGWAVEPPLLDLARIERVLVATRA